MYNNIKSKALGVHKRKVLLVFLLIITILTMVSCEKEEKEVEVTTYELELVSFYVEYRNVTNNFGGIIRTDEYIHYGYVDGNGQVNFNEIYRTPYIVFQITEGTPKVIISTSYQGTSYTFQLTREMYKNLNSNQQ